MRRGGVGVRVQVLGPIRAWTAGTELTLGSPRQRALLGLLALASGQPVGRAELIAMLWSDRPPPSATNVIQTHVKHLRRVLEPHRRPHGSSDILPSVGDGYALRVEADAVDVNRFRQLVAAARGHPRHEAEKAAALLDEALRLWHGPPFADVPALASHPKVAALQSARQAALAQYGELMIMAGAAIEALPAIEDAAAAQPLDEAAQALLVRAYQAAGQPARAFETYHRTRQRLAEELGVDPGAHLAAAHALLLGTTTAPHALASEGPTTPNEPTPVPIPNQLPADVYGFVGRTAELSMLDALLVEGPSTAAVIAAVSGTAGVGKTALAVHWAHRVRHRFLDGQLYVDLRGHDSDEPVSSGDALARLLAAVGVPAADIPLDLDERAARWRTEVTGRRMLVVLDNVASVEQARRLLPGTSSCVVVVTSRDNLAGLVALQGARRVSVDLLSLGDAVDLLDALIGPRVAAEPTAAEALAQRCARLPLALRIAAELAGERPGTPLAELVAELADQRRRLELLDVGEDARGAVRTVFSWSYERLPADSARAFRWFGVHPGPDLDLYGLAALGGVDLAAARRLVRPLVRAHLVQRTAAGRLALHDLLWAYAAERSGLEDDEPSRQAALDRLFARQLAICATAIDLLHPGERDRAGKYRGQPVSVKPAWVPQLADATAARAWLDAELPALVALCAFGEAHGHGPQVIQLAATLWRYLEGGHYMEALAIHTNAHDAAVRTGDALGQATALTSLGAVHRLFGRYSEATEHLRRALDLYRRTDDPHGEARARSNLGIVEERLGRNDAAIDHHRSALVLFRRAGDRYGEASTLNNLGAVYALGQYGPASEHYRQALALYRQLGDRLGEAAALSNLGMVDAQRGEHALAVRHHHQALALFRELGHRYGEAAVLNNLGDVDALLGRADSAVEHQRRALAVFQELGHRYGEASALNGLGEAVLSAGQPEEALRHHRSALAITVETGDRDEQARAHNGAGRACWELHRPAEARQHWERALAQYVELGQPQADEVRARLRALDVAS